ncbi:MAG: PTS sugar transporter subunit IIC [Erysipelotrichaceae bacterium]|jgi:PTS system mannose-specific IIC component|nr:PTS sugar transporter subunit IIC [Erysipelotrichaceae bacterium]
MQLSVIQCFLLALWAGYCSYDDQGPQMLRRPLLIGPVVGFVLGDLTTALIVSATLELTWMGLGNMAGYQTPDMILGTIIGTTFAITTGGELGTGVALATAVAILSQQLLLVFGFIRQFWYPWAERVALSGDFSGLTVISVVSAILQFAIRAIPCFIILYLGDEIIAQVTAAIPANVLSGISAASGILPAVGLSILMTIIMKKGMWAFLLLGFVLNAYLGLNTMAVTFISISFATIYAWILEIQDKSPAESSEKGGYDL